MSREQPSWISSVPVRILFAGGGTGGHLFPGIAVASELRRRHPAAQVVFAGSGKALEARVVERAGFAVDHIRTRGLVGQSAGSLLRGLALLPVSMFDAAALIRRHAPGLVIGLGGYSSGPIVLCAALRGLPTMLLEQNAVPGVTNRLLARVVRAAAVTSEATLPYFAGRGFVSGNPVRAGFFAAGHPNGEPESDEVRVLVVGGSQGAHAINVAMVAAAGAIARSPRPIRLTHQAGERDLELVRAGYRAAGLAARVAPFLEEMDREMAAAHLVVCRAGATTLAELAAAGRPAVLVPFGRAANDHQRRNAAAVEAAGAAEVVDERELSDTALGARVLALVADDGRRAALAAASRKLARPDAAGAVVDRMESLLAPRGGR